MRITERIVTLLRMIKFSHSIFALPFGLMTLFIAEGGWPRPSILLLVVVAMVGARTAAMAFNRLLDAEVDAVNPRTESRALPRGQVSRAEVWTLTLAGCAVFLLAAALLNRIALYFSPLVLVALLGYSWTKRFTSWCHFVLGVSLGLSPMGAWVASRGTGFLEGWWIPSLLGLAVVSWTAGFDIIYSCQDYEHDLKTRLHSIPKRLGIRGALFVSALLHAITVTLLGAVGFASGRNEFFFAGVIVVAALLFWEHRLVRPDDLSRVNAAFFTMNGLVSLVLLLATVLDLVLESP